jgi:L-rhamnose mutarotase
MGTQRYCFALDLKPDEKLIQEYETYHQQVWPQVLTSIEQAGILSMEIYRFANRLLMIMEVNGDFSFERKRQIDQQNEKVQQWEALMWKYQQAIPGAKEGEKWVQMTKIFSL